MFIIARKVGNVVSYWAGYNNDLADGFTFDRNKAQRYQTPTDAYGATCELQRDFPELDKPYAIWDVHAA